MKKLDEVRGETECIGLAFLPSLMGSLVNALLSLCSTMMT